MTWLDDEDNFYTWGNLPDRPQNSGNALALTFNNPSGNSGVAYDLIQQIGLERVVVDDQE